MLTSPPVTPAHILGDAAPVKKTILPCSKLSLKDFEKSTGLVVWDTKSTPEPVFNQVRDISLQQKSCTQRKRILPGKVLTLKDFTKSTALVASALRSD